MERARRLRGELLFLAALARLPPRVAAFQWRARRLAAEIGDDFSVISATRPGKLAVLLDEARGRRTVVELGTATAWTALSLLLADPVRTVLSYDPVRRVERGQYLRLVSRAASDRLTFVEAAGEEGPRGPEPVELLYIDSSHSREGTLHELEAWKHVLAEGAVVIFDDFTHPDYPGVREAVEQLSLQGEEREGLFVHRVT
ncbi:MAG: class I SAM-dependent methyltransferase [Actinomycetota bacterium]|nr:class I SAM-dependent methyltransferase [Actinomycetota bacterium]